MVVLKFGGTSVQDTAAMNQALDIVQGYLSRGVLLVSSAMSGVTNDLVRLVETIQASRPAESETLIRSLEDRHRLVQGASPEALAAQKTLDFHFDHLRALTRGSLLLQECSPRVQDAILATGELLSTTLLHFLWQSRGGKSVLLDARQLVVTDDHFGEAAVKIPETYGKIAALDLEPHRLSIVQGFIGATEAGVTTVLGRGGSDYSGSLFGAALSAEEIQIWTDVDGIMTTDPRKVREARSIPRLSYSEAAELAYFGAKVIHPATIQPAVERNIPVWVKNTKNPSHPGTVLTTDAPGTGLRAIAGKKSVTLITVTSSRMLNAFGFLYRIFEIFYRFRTAVDLVATSEVSVSMTIDEVRDMGGITAALEELGQVKVESGCGILCLVGQDLWKNKDFIARVFSSLPNLSVRMISLGSSEINLSLVVPEKDLDDAVMAIHKEFFPEP